MSIKDTIQYNTIENFLTANEDKRIEMSQKIQADEAKALHKAEFESVAKLRETYNTEKAKNTGEYLLTVRNPRSGDQKNSRGRGRWNDNNRRGNQQRRQHHQDY